MSKNKRKSRNDAASTSGGRKKTAAGPDKLTDANGDIIELSDIAIGTTPEDERIIELTEDLVDSAIEGVSRATGRMDLGDEILDLTPGARGEQAADGVAQADAPDHHRTDDPGDMDIVARDSVDSIEEDIAKELDNYFQIEEETQDLLDEPIPKNVPLPESDIVSGRGERFPEESLQLTRNQLESAIERVIQKMYGEKIDRILNEVIERVVTDDIERLKEYLLKRSS